ncbi:hypothetical protein JCM9957A_17220 [Kineosporia succinea]
MIRRQQKLPDLHERRLHRWTGSELLGFESPLAHQQCCIPAPGGDTRCHHHFNTSDMCHRPSMADAPVADRFPAHHRRLRPSGEPGPARVSQSETWGITP